MTVVSRRSLLGAGGALAASAVVATAVGSDGRAWAADSAPGARLSVGAGETVTVAATRRLAALTVAAGGKLVAASGKSLTVVVDGMETGQRISPTGGTDTVVPPGTYRGEIWLVVTERVAVAFSPLTFPFRQALYVTAAGVVAGKSVTQTVRGGTAGHDGAVGVRLASGGEAFNGVYVDGGSYLLRGVEIDLDGNGRCDFVGYGAAVAGNGASGRLVVEDSTIRTRGAVRTAVIANGGSTVLVKNSDLRARNGTLPADYVSTVNTEYMEDAPWMLGISGNVRATNLLGERSIAAYVNSSVLSEGWGALSADNGSDCTLLALNSSFGNTGRDGYGTYAIGNATEHILGCMVDVGTYATINRGGDVHYGDSGQAAVAELNDSLGLGLTATELAAIPARPTVVDSRRWGFMWHGAGSLTIDGGTQVRSALSTFLDKGQQVSVTVNGSDGARLDPGDGILFQLMENDDPGPVTVDGNVVNRGVYTEPTTAPTKNTDWNVTTAHDTDAEASFTDIALEGDFWNGMRDGLNLVLDFSRCAIRGRISASTTKHRVSSIDYTRYRELGVVSNTAGPVVNNGVIMSLGSGSRWTVTGTSYLSKLALASDATVAGPGGAPVVLKVDGTAAALKPGSTYTGSIEVAIA
jgi:hypothetical protein